FFFFQAEDGIRDKLVTGVQTCALPISPPRDRLAVRQRHDSRRHVCGSQDRQSDEMTTVGLVGGLGPESTIDYYRSILAAWERERSEERRVGKECRAGWRRCREAKTRE